MTKRKERGQEDLVLQGNKEVEQMVYDDREKKMYIKEREINLKGKGKKREILEYLIENRGKWSSAIEISEAIYGEAKESNVRVEIKKLKEKLGEGIDIRNRKGIGYKIEVKG